MMDFLGWLEGLSFSTWVRESGSLWGFPSLLFAHTFGMSVVAGGNATIDLAVLGCWPRAPIKPLERLYPAMWLGFGINAFTGTILLMAGATTKAVNPDFWVKMIFVFFGAGILYVMRKKVFADPQLDKGPMSASAKRLAWASLICWFGAIVAGRLLAYVGSVGGL